jgi:hypothetical protein
MDFPSGTGLLNDATVTYTGPATTIYIFGNSSINLCLLSATNFVASSVNNTIADKGISVKNNEILNTNNANLEVFSVLGKKVLSSTENISLKGLQKGIYFVRIAGTTESLKISI